MDGITLYAIRSEIAGYLPLKVQKIQQPRPKELVFSVWSASLRDRLVLSFEGNRPYFGFSDEKKENPAIPPGFCLGLRKRLEGGRLRDIRQHRMDRVLYLDFEGHDDFGNPAPFVLVFDLAGRGQNIGLYRDGILEAAAVPPTGDRFEHGSPYEPPSGERLDLSEPHSQGDIREALLGARPRQGDGPVPAISAVTSAIEGIGKDLAISILLTAGVDADRPLDLGAADEVAAALTGISARLIARTYCPAIYRDPKGQPLLHVLPLSQFPAEEAFGSVLDGLRSLRQREIAIASETSFRAYAEALYRKVLKKVESRFQAQTQDYARSQDYMKYKVWAQLLDTSGVKIPSGHTEAHCLDYYRVPPIEVTVPLDPKYSARDNARHYWNRYAKFSRGQKVLEESLAKTSAELERIAQAQEVLEQAGNPSASDTADSMTGQPNRADTKDSLERAALLLEALARKNGISFRRPHGLDQIIRARRAARSGTSPHVRGATPRSAAGGPKPGSPKLEVVEGVNGVTFFIGGNARQNDYLITTVRKPGDLWLHVKNAKGAHVLLRPTQGSVATDDDVLTGARLAAERSEARAAAKVEVDFVDAARIRKPRGGAPGFVTYTGQKTILVSLR